VCRGACFYWSSLAPAPKPDTNPECRETYRTAPRGPPGETKDTIS
jgi:hypothetical protein